MAIDHTELDPLSAIFSALGNPTRRAILERLASGEASVQELGEPFGVSQPTISRHLKVLEEAGLIEGVRDAQRRPRRIRLSAIRTVDDWLAPYRQLWERRLDNLDRHLKTKPSRRER